MRDYSPDNEDSWVLDEFVGFPTLLEINLTADSITQIDLSIQEIGDSGSARV